MNSNNVILRYFSEKKNIRWEANSPLHKIYYYFFVFIYIIKYIVFLQNSFFQVLEMYLLNFQCLEGLAPFSRKRISLVLFSSLFTSMFSFIILLLSSLLRIFSEAHFRPAMRGGPTSHSSAFCFHSPLLFETHYQHV